MLIPNTIVSDLLQFVKFVLEKKIILQGDTYIEKKEVKKYYNRDIYIKDEDVKKLSETGINSGLFQVDADNKFYISKENRLASYKMMIDTYNEFIREDKEVDMYSSFFEITMREFLMKDYLSFKKPSYQIKIDKKLMYYNLEMYLNFMEIFLDFEQKDITKIPINRGEVKMIGNYLGNIFLYMRNHKLISQNTSNYINKAIKCSTRYKLFSTPNANIPNKIDFLTFDLVFYEAILLIYTENPNVFTESSYITLQKISSYLQKPTTNNYSSAELSNIEILSEKYNKVFPNNEQLSEVETKKINTVINNINNRGNLKKELKSKILGQDEIIDKIVDDYIGKLYLGINKRPLSLLLLGRSGTGKTELGKSIASAIGSKHLYLPLGNFNAEHTVQTLLGAPPSYIGNDKPSIIEQYMSELKDVQYPVIIFDEVEKSHHNIQNMLLELLDEGTITFLNGNKLSFHNAIIIFTGNLGISQDRIGFDNMMSVDEKKQLSINEMDKAARRFFKPEVYNRITDVFYFNPLDKETIDQIVRLKIKQKLNDIKDNNIINYIIGKNKVFNIDTIYEELKKEIKLDDIDNIRKIESYTENLIANKIYKYVQKK